MFFPRSLQVSYCYIFPRCMHMCLKKQTKSLFSTTELHDPMGDPDHSSRPIHLETYVGIEPPSEFQTLSTTDAKWIPC